MNWLRWLPWRRADRDEHIIGLPTIKTLDDLASLQTKLEITVARLEAEVCAEELCADDDEGDR